MVSLAQPEPRERMLRVRCSSAEYQRWQALAASHDGTLSSMVRGLLEGVPPLRQRRTPTTDPQLIRQVAMLSNNMNQIARAVNAAHVAGAKASAIDILSALASIDRQIRRLLDEAGEQ